MPHTICNGLFRWVCPSMRQLGPRGSAGYISIISPVTIASSDSRIPILRCLSRSVWVKEILYLLFLTFSLMSSISILELQYMGIQSPDIMADSADLKQMLVRSSDKPAQGGNATGRCIISASAVRRTFASAPFCPHSHPQQNQRQQADHGHLLD